MRFGALVNTSQSFYTPTLMSIYWEIITIYLPAGLGGNYILKKYRTKKMGIDKFPSFFHRKTHSQSYNSGPQTLYGIKTYIGK